MILKKIRHVLLCLWLLPGSQTAFAEHAHCWDNNNHQLLCPLRLQVCLTEENYFGSCKNPKIDIKDSDQTVIYDMWMHYKRVPSEIYSLRANDAGIAYDLNYGSQISVQGMFKYIEKSTGKELSVGAMSSIIRAKINSKTFKTDAFKRLNIVNNSLYVNYIKDGMSKKQSGCQNSEMTDQDLIYWTFETSGSPGKMICKSLNGYWVRYDASFFTDVEYGDIPY